MRTSADSVRWSSAWGGHGRRATRRARAASSSSDDGVRRLVVQSPRGRVVLFEARDGELADLAQRTHSALIER